MVMENQEMVMGKYFVKSAGTLLLPTGGEERGVFGFRSISVAILPLCQDMNTIAI